MIIDDLSDEDFDAIHEELQDKALRRTLSQCEPMRTFFAVQHQVANGHWDTTKLFYTQEFAQSYVNRTGGNLRIEQTEREIND